ncbi:MAG: TIGR04076 family protein [Phycisphaerales bacterium]|nr:MAG: TIGR04076 family protein [Phycisphaerales bacterium]
MYDLKVSVHTVKGHCDLPMKKGDYFLVKGGKLFIPEGKYFCLYALQSVLPLLPAKQRNIVEKDDWLPDVKYVSCPDPAGLVILKIEREKVLG